MGQAEGHSFLLLCLVNLCSGSLRKSPLTSSNSSSTTNVASVSPVTSTPRQSPLGVTAPVPALKRPAKHKTLFPPEGGQQTERAAERAEKVWSVPSDLNLELTAQGVACLQACTVSPLVAVRYLQSWKTGTNFMKSKTSSLPKALAQTAAETFRSQLLDLASFGGSKTLKYDETILLPTAQVNWVLADVHYFFTLRFPTSSMEQLLFPTLPTSAMNNFLKGLQVCLGASFAMFHLYLPRHGKASSAIAVGLQRYEKTCQLAQVRSGLPAAIKPAGHGAEVALKAVFAKVK